MSQEDLIPLSERTTQEVKKIARRGGINSGIARREKRDLKKKLKAYLETLDASGLSNEEKIITKLGSKALKGDIFAVREIWDRIEGKPHQSSNVDLSADITVAKRLFDDEE